MTLLTPFIATSTVDDGSMLNRDNEDDPQVVVNRKNFLERNGIDIQDATRVNVQYGDQYDYLTYKEVGKKEKGLGMQSSDVFVADALITKTPGQALFLPLADCVGAILFDPAHNVLMVSHFGRHSLEKNGATTTVEYLKKHHKSDPSSMSVWLSPAPSKASYPIWALGNKGMKEATYEQLLAAGILPQNIFDNNAQTDQDTRYFSHSEYLAGHRESDGRYAVVAVLR
jgi:copper oxidase (laccase) domain-containing protein